MDKINVSVVMGVYNCEHYLKEAIKSILSQSFTEIELIIVNDGSTDCSLQVMESFSDPRIIILQNNVKKGLSYSLNRAIKISRGKYIARMDADDISLPERLIKQFRFMELNYEVGACGTWAYTIDNYGEVIGSLKSPTGSKIKNEYWKPSPIIHPTAMIRTSIVSRLLYDDSLPYAQDYDLWFRIRTVAKLDNLPEKLMKYRVHPKSITTEYRDSQLKITFAIFNKYINSKFTYDDFLSILLIKTDINPLRRWYKSHVLARILGLNGLTFFCDNIRYCLLWMKTKALNWKSVRSY